MPKNKGKGGKNRRRGKNENDVMKRELIKKDDDNQAYAQVTKMLGNGRLQAFCFDGKNRLCHIRGKLRKKVWINAGDIILVGLRDYQDEKADVILKYTPDEARVLKNEGQLPESAKLNEGGEDMNEGEVEFVDFGDNSDSDDEVAAQDRRTDFIDSESSSEEESDDSDEDDAESEEDPELVAQREETNKPGGKRDHTNKGKRK
ncbi:protein synthesis factor [Aphelenchoides avenae]|nr:protein synthesis factor [Aphelenchus avenae]